MPMRKTTTAAARAAPSALLLGAPRHRDYELRALPTISGGASVESSTLGATRRNPQTSRTQGHNATLPPKRQAPQHLTARVQPARSVGEVVVAGGRWRGHRL